MTASRWPRTDFRRLRTLFFWDGSKLLLRAVIGRPAYPTRGGMSNPLRQPIRRSVARMSRWCRSHNKGKRAQKWRAERVFGPPLPGLAVESYLIGPRIGDAHLMPRRQ